MAAIGARCLSPWDLIRYRLMHSLRSRPCLGHCPYITSLQCLGLNYEAKSWSGALFPESGWRLARMTYLENVIGY